MEMNFYDTSGNPFVFQSSDPFEKTLEYIRYQSSRHIVGKTVFSSPGTTVSLTVSTVFLGMGYPFGLDYDPLIYETAVLVNSTVNPGIPEVNITSKHSSWQSAFKSHTELTAFYLNIGYQIDSQELNENPPGDDETQIVIDT